MNVNRHMQIFRMSQSGPGIQVNGAMLSGGSQPARNRIDVIALIRIMLAYSPRKNRPKLMELYSTKNPATISDSPSGRSNGARLVSASAEMKKIINIGNSGMKNHTLDWARTISVRLRLPTHNSTVT